VRETVAFCTLLLSAPARTVYTTSADCLVLAPPVAHALNICPRLVCPWHGSVRLCVCAFGSQVYSDQLKNITGFTQDEIQTVASTGNIGLYFAIVAGLVFDNVVSDVPRMPPRVPGVAAHPNTGQRSISWLTS
jgi:hypothetical protein